MSEAPPATVERPDTTSANAESAASTIAFRPVRLANGTFPSAIAAAAAVSQDYCRFDYAPDNFTVQDGVYSDLPARDYGDSALNRPPLPANIGARLRAAFCGLQRSLRESFEPHDKFSVAQTGGRCSRPGLR